MNGRMEQIKPERAPSAHPAYHDRSLSTLSLAGTLNPTQRFAKKRQHGQGQAAVAVAQSNLYKKRIFLNLLIGYSFYGTVSFTQNYRHTPVGTCLVCNYYKICYNITCIWNECYI